MFLRPFTHAALVGCAVALASSSAPAQDPPPHPQVDATTLELTYRTQDEQGAVEETIPIKLISSLLPSDLSQVVDLPAPLSSLRLERYLPLAVPVQRIVAEESEAGRPALRLSIEGPKQKFDQCLIVGNPQRNRIISMIANWRCAQAAGEEERAELYRSFVEEPNRKPRVTIASEDGQQTLDLAAEEGASGKLGELGVRVLRFFPHYNFDETRGASVNLSERRENPAVEVEVDGPEGKVLRWIFARFPDYASPDSAPLPCRVTFDCPTADTSTTPDYVLVAVGEGRHELWSRIAGQAARHLMEPGERVPIPGSNYTFRITESLDRARLVEDYESTYDARRGRTALRVGLELAPDRWESHWLEMGVRQELPVAGGTVEVRFGRKDDAPAHGG